MTEDRKEGIRLEGNPYVDREILADLSRIRKKLEKHGLKPGRGYRIAPALGGEISDDFPRPERARTHRTSAWNVIPDTDG